MSDLQERSVVGIRLSVSCAHRRIRLFKSRAYALEQFTQLCAFVCAERLADALFDGARGGIGLDEQERAEKAVEKAQAKAEKTVAQAQAKAEKTVAQAQAKAKKAAKRNDNKKKKSLPAANPDSE